MVLLDRSVLLERQKIESSNLNVSQAAVAEAAAAVAVAAGAEVAGAAAVVLLRTSTLPTLRRSLLSKRAVLQVDCWYLEKNCMFSREVELAVGNAGVRRRGTVAGAEQDEHSRFDRSAGMLGMRVLCVGCETLCGRAVGGEKCRMC